MQCKLRRTSSRMAGQGKKRIKNPEESAIKDALAEVHAGRPIPKMAEKYRIACKLLRQRFANLTKEEIEEIENRPTINRKKWTDQELQQLFKFLRTNVPIEHPTPNEYYKKFLQQSKKDTTWGLVHCKVKLLRRKYQSTVEHFQSKLCSDLPFLEDDDATNKDLMLKMCPYFDELKIIFGNDNNTSTPLSSSEIEGATNDSQMIYPMYMCTNSLNVTTNSTQNGKVAPVGTEFASENGIKEEVSIQIDEDDLGEVYSSTIASNRNELPIDVKLKEMELLLKEKELELKKEQLKHEEKKYIQELKIREAEIQNQLKFRILELEMKERITLRELEVKEKIEMQKIKAMK